jgi:hypothetical protein
MPHVTYSTFVLARATLPFLDYALYRDCSLLFFISFIPYEMKFSVSRFFLNWHKVGEENSPNLAPNIKKSEKPG